MNVELLEPSAVHLLVIDHTIGDTANLVIRRDGTSRTLELTIGRRSADAARWAW